MRSRTFLMRKPAFNWDKKAADFTYMKKGMQNPEFANLFKNMMGYFKKYPCLIERYFKISIHMNSKGLKPFVHAQTAPMRVGRLFSETLSGKPKETFFHYFRPPSGKYTKSAKEIREKVDHFVLEHGNEAWTPGDWNFNATRLDTHPDFRDHLVSLSYTMMDFTLMESAAHFLFQNTSAIGLDSAKKASNEAIESFFKRRQLNAQPVLDELNPYYDQYGELPHGTLYVVGIPETMLDHVVYDSKSYGIPTKEPIPKQPWESKRAFTSNEGGPQARLMICNETMNSNSGIEIVDVTDEEETKAYCGNRDFRKATGEELKAQQKRALLDQSLKSYAERFKR